MVQGQPGRGETAGLARENCMRLYLGFDDTDDADADFGTGRVVRDFCALVGDRAVVAGIIRHQLPRLEGIPYTSHNSSACVLLDVPGRESLPGLVELAAGHLQRVSAPGADPGLCCALADEVPDGLVGFGLECNGRKVSQADALRATAGLTLLGLGGTNDGIIGAAAAVGLTRYGWSGRCIIWGNMRSLPDPVSVAQLAAEGVRTVNVDRDALVPQPGDLVRGGWIRPSVLAGQPVLQVLADGPGCWRTAHTKRPKAHAPNAKGAQAGHGAGRGPGTGGGNGAGAGLRNRPTVPGIA